MPTHPEPVNPDDAAFLHHAEAICRTKAAYTSRAEANTFARRRDYPLQAYRCPWCGLWHHTSLDRAKAKAFNRRLRRLLRTPDTAAVVDAY